jgi:hypothetical protein
MTRKLPIHAFAHDATCPRWRHQRRARVLQKEGNLWKTPQGSNDDWYWLYGTVSACQEGVLISNDMMRDHIFELLRPRYFNKWKAHHQFGYHIESPEVAPVITPPPVYTTCVQHLPESGAWMIPLSMSRWLCARPRHTGGGASPSVHRDAVALRSLD